MLIIETISWPIRNIAEAHGRTPDKHNVVSFRRRAGLKRVHFANTLRISYVMMHK